MRPYPPIEDYAMIGDCHAVALVSKAGSIDWCCMPRIDSDSCFGRLLDWERGGHFTIAPADTSEVTVYRSYLDDTSLVLVTTMVTPAGEVRIIDFFAMRQGGRDQPYRVLHRIVEGVRGHVLMEARVAPVFDYGEVQPWMRRVASNVVAAIGGNGGLLIGGEVDLDLVETHQVACRFDVHTDERRRFSVRYVPPHHLDLNPPDTADPDEVDRRLEETRRWWRRWGGRARLVGPDALSAGRSATVLKGLSHAPTGAIAAAATTSLPEEVGGSRNWDYRYSWIRDSSFAVRALAEVGFEAEADGFRRFIERSSAGSALELQIMYGLGGERRLTEVQLDLEGYAGSRPVRVGNAASAQRQLDAYGELVILSWDWHRRGHSPDDDFWRFLVDLVDVAAERWRDPDRGIWEIRGEPRHFVHSKAMCWVALDRGARLADECMRRAPVRRWRKEAAACRRAIEENGCDRDRGVFVQAFGEREMDSALLLLPSTGFVEYKDERMVRTVDAVRADLEVDGLLLRYRPRKALDGQDGDEGVFVACSFWLVECLARQGRTEEAREMFDRVTATSNDLGLYAEEYDPRRRTMLGNFPQALSHLSHLAAASALAASEAARRA